MPRLRHDERRTAPIPKPPKLGQLVRTEFPTGDYTWRIVAIPDSPGPSDVATLAAASGNPPIGAIRRRIRDLTPIK